MAIKIWGAGSTQGTNQDWNTATNWDNDTLPIDGDSLLFDGSAVNYLKIGPTAPIHIENITITSGANETNHCYIDTENMSVEANPLIVYGAMINNSQSTYGGKATAKLPLVAWGITSIVGPWYSKLVVDTNPYYMAMYPLTKAYLAMQTVLFDYFTQDYLTFENYPLSGGYMLKYGEGSISGVVNENSINSFTFQNLGSAFGGMISGSSAAYYSGFDISAIYAIDSTTINIDNSQLFYSYTATQNFGLNGLQLKASTVNFYNIAIPFLATNLSFSNPGGSFLNNAIAHFPNACTINAYNCTSFNKDIILHFEAAITYPLNLYGNSRFYGTNEVFSGMGGGISDTLLSSNANQNYVTATLNITAYGSSIIMGILENGGFRSYRTSTDGVGAFGSMGGQTSYYGPYVQILLKNNAMFNGLIVGNTLGGSNLTFSDSSNYSAAFQMIGSYSGGQSSTAGAIIFAGTNQGVPILPLVPIVYKSSF